MEVKSAGDGPRTGVGGVFARLGDWYSHHVVERPFILMVIGLLIPLAIGVPSILFIWPVQIDSTGGSFVPKASTIGAKEDSIVRAEEQTRFNPLRDLSGVSTLQASAQTTQSYTVTVDYWMKNGDNIFNESQVAFIRQLEEKVFNLTNYTDFCWKNAITGTCMPAMSLMPYLYASPIVNCSKLLADGQSSTLALPIDDTLRNLIDPTRNATYCGACVNGTGLVCTEPSTSAVDAFVMKTFGYPASSDPATTTPNLTSTVTKTLFGFGFPLAGYNNSQDRNPEQVAKVEAYIRDHVLPVLGQAQVNNAGVTVLISAPVQLEEHFNTIIFNDSILVTVAIGMVWLYVWFHVGSVFISSLGITHVILSFPCAYFCMQILMTIAGMSVLNFMALFIILGIGADDIFIFVDAWKQSAHVNFGVRPDGDPHSEQSKRWFKKRLAWAYGRAARAMFITSLTTGCAFLMNLLSSIVTIQVFGFFTAMMVFINYLEVITLFPCVVLYHERYMRSCCCCRDSDCCNAGPVEGAGGEREVIEMGSMASGKGGGKSAASDGTVTVNLEDLRFLERWFHNSFAPFMNRFRIPLGVLFAGFLGVSIYYAIQLVPQADPTVWLPKEDPVQQLFELENNVFKSIGNTQQLWVSQGLGVIDRAGTNVYNADELGTATFQADFDLSAPSAQQAYIDQCQRFRNSSYVRNGEVLCPMENFRTYVLSEINTTFPVPQAEFIDRLADFTQWYETSTGTPAKIYVEGDENANTRQTRRSFRMADLTQTIRWSMTEKKLLYMVTVVNTTMTALDSAALIRPVYTYWNDLLQAENALQANVAATLTGAMQTTRNYVEMELQDTLLSAAILGMGLSLALAAGIILLTTRDVVISFLAIFAIAGVVVSLIAAMVWLGWELGVIESICMTILVGLSVDYTIHLAQAYRESPATNRADRIVDGLTSMGISVISASATSILSAIVLFFTTITFFVKFGIFIALTIAFSTFYAFGLFIVLLAFVGRNKNYNDFYLLWRLITCRGCRSE